MIIIIHIEKTAGTTLNYIFINNLIHYYSLNTWDKWTNNPNTAISYQQINKLLKIYPFIKGIGGHHIRFSDTHIGESNMKYITFVREPVTRYLSHWRHQRYKKNINWSIEEFLNEPRFNNFMVRKFSKSTNIEEAISKVDKLDFVGVQEDFDSSLILMKSKLNLGEKFCLNYKYKNKGIRENNTESLNNEILCRIKTNNNKDIVLYDYIVKKIHERNKAMYKGDLISDVNDLKIKNKNYKENQIKMLIQSLSKYILIRPLDYIINRQ